MVRVLVVDDSAFMRNAISNMLSSDAEIQVIGTAKDGLEAIAKIKTLRPDIVTLDVEMPRMDGLEALKHIMAANPVPVVMVSSLTTEGAKVTLQALELGALDFIPKNLSDLSLNILKIKEVLIERIKLLSRKKVARLKEESPAGSARVVIPMPAATKGERRIGVLAIGTSTGGPKALQEILPKLPKNFPVPIVIAQHMPPNFTGPFAERLDQLSEISVKEAAQNDKLEPGLALIAPGGNHMRIKRTGAIETRVEIIENTKEFIYRPSVDALISSVALVYPGRGLGVILTGMGNDGVKGARELKKSGGRIFIQDEKTSVVFGMPKAVLDENLADKVIPLGEIAGEIINAV